MVNHIETKPEVIVRMHISKDGKSVVTETVIRDTRPISYFTEDLLP